MSAATLRQQIMKALATDSFMATWRLHNVLPGKPPTRRVRAELLRMEREGLVQRYPYYCAVNNTVWQAAAQEGAQGERT